MGERIFVEEAFGAFTKSVAEESVEIKNSNLKNTETEFVNSPKASSTNIR